MTDYNSFTPSMMLSYMRNHFFILQESVKRRVSKFGRLLQVQICNISSLFIIAILKNICYWEKRFNLRLFGFKLNINHGKFKSKLHKSDFPFQNQFRKLLSHPPENLSSKNFFLPQFTSPDY